MPLCYAHFLRIATVAAVAVSFAGAAVAVDYPARKPGLWEMAMQTGATGKGQAMTMTTQQCIDAATDKALQAAGGGAGKSDCSKQELRTEGKTLVIDSVCKSGGATVTSRGVMSGDFSSAYRMDISSRYSPALGGMSQSTTVIEAKWLGACKAGQKPGDMIMPGGMKMNVLQMMGGKK